MTRLTEPEIESTRTQRSALPGLQRAAPRAEVSDRPKPASQAKHLSRLWLLVPVAIVAAVAGTWYAVHRYRSAAEQADITLFEIKRMSFPVILTAKGEIKAKKNTELRCEVEGRSTIVWLIEEGKQVKKGDLLVELANDAGGGGTSIDDRIKKQEIDVANAKAALENAEKNYEILLDKNESDIRKAKLALEMAEANLNKYIEGDAKQAVQTAQLNREEAKAILDRRLADLENSVKLFERGYITKTEHENDKFAAYKARIELEKAKLSEQILQKYTNQLELRQKESDVEEARKDLERTRKSAAAQAAQSKAQLEAKRSEYGIQKDKLAKLIKQRDKLKIHAPGPGMVVYHRSGRHWDPQRIEVGGTVHERQALIDLPDPSVMQVEVKINESKMDKVDLDLPVTIEVEGIPDALFTGRITKIGVLADAQNRWLNPNLKEYTNEITLDRTHPDLKPGMSAQVEILVRQLEDVLAVPVQSVFSKGGHSYVFVSGGEARYKEVKLGLASTDYVEVLEGLKPGDRVCLTINEDMKRMLPTNVGPGENRTVFPARMMPGAGKKGGPRSVGRQAEKNRSRAPKRSPTRRPPRRDKAGRT